VALALTIGPVPGDTTIPDATLEAAWLLYGVLLLDGYPPERRPWAWWAFESDIPDELRGERPQLIPLDQAAERRRELEDLEHRRAVWLAEHGTGSARSKGARSATN
jgi:hypothetical protein